jgi:hypothetical protein
MVKLTMGFKRSLMWVFWAFKLSFDVDILVFLATFSKNFIQFSGHTVSDPNATEFLILPC